MTEAPLARPQPRIDHPDELDRMVRQIVERIDPVAIYLFGSRARGDADADSDYDLMVVVPDERMDRQIWDRLSEARRSSNLISEMIPVAASGFAARRHAVGTLSFEVAHDGIRIYPRTPRRLWIEEASPPSGDASMNRRVVESWLAKVGQDLRMAGLACDAADPMPDQAAYHIQQAAEKLTKAALVAHEIRPRKGHVIKKSAERLPDQFPYRARFLALDRFSEHAWAHRYPEEDLARQLPPAPSVPEARAWLDEVTALKADIERWLEAREGGAGA